VSEQLLAVLRLCLLGLIYLFFLRVLRAVWVEVHGPRRVRAPKPARAAAGPVPVPVAPLAGAPNPTGATTIIGSPSMSPASMAPSSTARPTTPRRNASLRVIEPAAFAGQTFGLADETTLGRAPGCLIQLDDTYVSTVHARVSRSGDDYVVEDLNSTNGTYVNRSKVTSPTLLREGDRLQVGNVVMELV
jgi:FHA domain